MENKMYIVKTAQGGSEDYWVDDKFVTFDENVAKAWVDKYNRILDKARGIYLKPVVRKSKGYGYYVDIKKYPEYIQKRFWFIKDLYEAFYEEIEAR